MSRVFDVNMKIEPKKNKEVCEHDTAADISESLKDSSKFGDYFSFTTIRDPSTHFLRENTLNMVKIYWLVI